MGDVMEVEELDYSEEPFLDRVIFRNPNLYSPASGTSPTSDSIPSSTASMVSYPGHSTTPLVFGSVSIDSPTLNCPPLSPSTLHILSAITPPSPSFDLNPPINHLHPSSLTLFSAPPEDLPASDGQNLPISANSPLGCSETLAVKVKSAAHLPQEGSITPNPLSNHPSKPRTGKQKTKCVKGTSKDITICFGESTTIGEVAYMASTVLVGHVRGRAYSADRLTLWVREIWGSMLKELPEVQVLPKGWFALHFAKANYTDLILARYWHIEMAPVLLKR